MSRRQTLQSISVLGALGLTGTANVASASSSDGDEDEYEDEENENSDSLENSDLDEDTFSSETIEINDVELHYVIGGDGPPVVLLHGWPQTWYEWQNVMPELAKDYTSAGPFMTQLMNQVATDVRGGSISSSGHWITEEQPDALTVRLLDFLANNN